MKKVISILAIVSLLIGSAYADNKTGNENNKNSATTTTSIKGIVLDKDTGEALAGVKVIIEELDQTVYTDLEGNFEFSNVVKDTYHIDTQMISYEKESTKVDVNTSENLKIELENK